MNKNLVIIFDFNGTIADTMNSTKDIMNKLSDDFGFKKVKDVDLDGLKGKESKEVFKEIGIPLIKLPRVLKKVRTVLNEEIEKIKPIKGMRKVLHRLKKNGYKLGILSSSLKATVGKFLKNNNLNLFDFIYSESNIFNKAKKIDVLLKEKKLNPKYVFYIGDETRDIEAAKKAGVKTIAVSWGFNNEKILRKQNPDYLAKEPKELVELLNRF